MVSDGVHSLFHEDPRGRLSLDRALATPPDHRPAGTVRADEGDGPDLDDDLDEPQEPTSTTSTSTGTTGTTGASSGESDEYERVDLDGGWYLLKSADTITVFTPAGEIDSVLDFSGRRCHTGSLAPDSRSDARATCPKT
jgi:hypothetical protein